MIEQEKHNESSGEDREVWQAILEPHLAKHSETPREGMLYPFLALFVLAVATALRLHLANQLGLGDSEAYYYAWAQRLDWSFYDHPPGTAVLIWLGTRIMGDNPLGVRFGSLVFITGMSLLVYLMSASLFRSRRVGFWALFLFSATPVFFVGGFAAAPDTAFGFFWLLSALMLHQAMQRESRGWLIATGIPVGLGLLFKYFMVLFWPSALLYLLFSRSRRLLFTDAWIIAILVSLVFFLPVLYWNAQHDWASFIYHLSARHHDAAYSGGRFLQFLLGQLVYLSPVVAVALWFCVIRLVLGQAGEDGRDNRLFFWISVPTLAFFFTLGAWTPETEPHWTLAGYLLLFPVLARWVMGLSTERAGTLASTALIGPFALWFRPRLKHAVLTWLLGSTLLINLLLCLHMSTDVFLRLIPTDLYRPRYDITNELYGWEEVGLVIRQNLEELGPSAFVASYHYTMCGQLDFALKGDTELACLSPKTDAFDFFDPPAIEGRNGIFVTDNRFAMDPKNLILCEGGLAKLRDVSILRGGMIVRRFHLWRCYNYQGQLAPGDPVNEAGHPPSDTEEALEPLVEPLHKNQDVPPSTTAKPTPEVMEL